MRTLNEKSYHKLTPDERIRLLIAAVSRHDTEEVESLWQTCPWYPYTAKDLNFYARYHAISDISYIFLKECARFYALIKKCEEPILQHWTDPDASSENEKLIVEIAENVKSQTISSLKGLYDGLVAFCKELDIDSEDFLKSISIKEVFGDTDLYLSSDIEANAAYALQIKSVFLERWDFKPGKRTQ